MTDRQADHLRHHLARRRAVARRLDDEGREAAHRAPARAAAGRRHRGRLRGVVERRLRGGEGDRRSAIKDSTVCSLARANDRDISPRRRGAARAASRRASTPSSPPATLHMEKKLRMTPRAGASSRRRLVGALRAQPERRHRVLARGRLPLGPGLPLPRPRGGDRRGRDDDQHPRHRRLRGPRAVRRVPARPARARSRTPTRRSGRCTATTTSAWRSPTRSPASRSAARARSSARSTASASAPATARSRRS